MPKKAHRQCVNRSCGASRALLPLRPSALDPPAIGGALERLSELEISRSPERRYDGPVPVEASERSPVASPPGLLTLAISPPYLAPMSGVLPDYPAPVVRRGRPQDGHDAMGKCRRPHERGHPRRQPGRRQTYVGHWALLKHTTCVAQCCCVRSKRGFVLPVAGMLGS